MREYPQPGERWQHTEGWTVTILRFIAPPVSVLMTASEFSREVVYRYDSDGHQTTSPLVWFDESYTRIAGAPRRDVQSAGGSGGFSPSALHPSVIFERWRERSERKPCEPDDSDYSHYL
ncbi:hypothetical protein [Erwinia persicina]|uniref:hypothetical protein n=1 Tax=Erwinia persicina TaxID=55211 RepID=UPI0039AF687C